MGLFRRPPAEVVQLLPRGERALAWAATKPDAWVAATDERLVGQDPQLDLPWVRVLGAAWDDPVLELSVLPVASGTVSRDEVSVVRLTMADAGVLPQVVRERIMQSMLTQQHVKVRGSLGVRFFARRDPATDEVGWQRVVDTGLDPADPAVARAIGIAQEELSAVYGV